MANTDRMREKSELASKYAFMLSDVALEGYTDATLVEFLKDPDIDRVLTILYKEPSSRIYQDIGDDKPNNFRLMLKGIAHALPDDLVHDLIGAGVLRLHRDVSIWAYSLSDKGMQLLENVLVRAEDNERSL